jgi:Do/DeqQ family serine protease
MRHKIMALAVLVAAMSPLSGQAQQVPASQAQIALSFAPLVREAAPAVVNIYATRVVEGREGPFSNDPFFEQFFRDFGKPTARVQNSLGSGVILSDDGLVVSNFHVVGGATDIRVVLTDRREFNAEVLLADEESDLAVLRLTGAQDLPFLTLRDSDAAEVGELVLAIGNPFGVGQTVSSGIVSGLARSAASLGRGYFLQTDAPVNPGNSGGALIGMDGKLLGVNTAIITRSGGSNGVGFAIPANLVGQVMAQARAGNDRFLRPWAGVSGQSVDMQMAEAFGLDRPLGIILNDIHPDSPFAAAGLRPGDVVLSVGGAEVNSPQEIMFRLAVAGVGGQMDLTYARDGEERQTVVDLIEAPESAQAARLTITEGSLAGLSVAQIDAALISELDLPVTAEGVLVTAVEGRLSRVGLAPGDVLTGINGEPIKTVEDVARVVAEGGRRWAIDAQRGSTRLRLRFSL